MVAVGGTEVVGTDDGGSGVSLAGTGVAVRIGAVAVRVRAGATEQAIRLRNSKMKINLLIFIRTPLWVVIARINNKVAITKNCFIRNRMWHISPSPVRASKMCDRKSSDTKVRPIGDGGDVAFVVVGVGQVLAHAVFGHNSIHKLTTRTSQTILL